MNKLLVLLASAYMLTAHAAEMSEEWVSVNRLKVSDSPVTGVTFLGRSQEFLAMELKDEPFRLSDIITEQNLDMRDEANETINKLSFSADGSLAVRCVNGFQNPLSQLYLFSMKSTEYGWLTLKNELVEDDEFFVHNIAFHPSNLLLAIAHLKNTQMTRIDRDGHGKLALSAISTFEHNDEAETMEFSPDGALLARAIKSGGKIDLLRVEDGTLISTFDTGLTRGANSLAFSPDSRHIATISEGIVNLWKLNRANNALLVEHKARLANYTAREVVFSPNNTQFATASPWHKAALWDLATATVAGVLFVDEPSYSVAFDRSGAQIAVGYKNGTAEIFQQKA